MMEIERTKRLLEVSLGVRPGESVLVVTDDSTEAIGRMVWRAALALDAQAVLMTMPTATHSGVEPPEVVAAAMARADVVIVPTAHSITHTNARRIAVEHGARLATMPGITEDMFVRGAVTADYDEVERLTLQLTALLDAADSARIEKDGLTLHFDLRGRGGVPSTGKYLLPGQSGNLPSGEAYIAPVENGTHGEIIVDGSFVGLGKLDAPLRLRIENGVLQSVQGPR